MYSDPSGHWIETVFDLLSLGASAVEVVVNPANLWSWAGLIGDAVDLFPYVTGIGEAVKATKMVKYTDEVIDSSYRTIKFVKAENLADSFADKGSMLAKFDHINNHYNFTVSNHVDGTKLHKLFMGNGGSIKTTKLMGDGTIKNITLRYDGLDKLTNSLFELKPYNIRNARKGVVQILNYNEALGSGYKMIIVLY